MSSVRLTQQLATLDEHAHTYSQEDRTFIYESLCALGDIERLKRFDTRLRPLNQHNGFYYAVLRRHPDVVEYLIEKQDWYCWWIYDMISNWKTSTYNYEKGQWNRIPPDAEECLKLCKILQLLIKHADRFLILKRDRMPTCNNDGVNQDIENLKHILASPDVLFAVESIFTNFYDHEVTVWWRHFLFEQYSELEARFDTFDESSTVACIDHLRANTRDRVLYFAKEALYDTVVIPDIVQYIMVPYVV